MNSVTEKRNKRRLLSDVRARIVLFLLFTLPELALAGGVNLIPGKSATLTPCDPNKLCNPIKYDNLNAFLIDILKVVVQYGAILVVFFLVFAGFKFVTAQGNTEKISEAKKMLVWVVIGAFVLLGVYVIRQAICGTLGQLGVQNLQC